MKTLFLILSFLFVSSCSANGEWSGHTMQREKKVCVVGDTGMGTKEQDKVADAMHNHGCTDILIAGDVIYPSGLISMNDKDFKLKFLDPYKTLFKKATFYPALGNHDYYGKQEVWLTIGESYPQIHFPHYWYKFVIGDTCFFAIDTNWYKIKMYKWLRSELKKNKGCRKKIVFGHHPYKSSGSHGDANPARKLLMRYGFMGKADLYIAGHDHQLSDEGIVRGTRQLISGAGAKLRPLKKNPEWGVSELGFVSLDLKEMTYTFINYKGEVLYSGGF